MNIGAFLMVLFVFISVNSIPLTTSIVYSGDLYCVIFYDASESCTKNSISWAKTQFTDPQAIEYITIDNIRYLQSINSRGNDCCVTFIVKNVTDSDHGIYVYKHIDSDQNEIFGGIWYNK